MPGLIYLYFPALKHHFNWDSEQALWFSFINGMTQNPLTSLRIYENLKDFRDEKDIEKFERTGNDLSLKQLSSNQTLYMVKSMYEVNKNGTAKYNRLGFNKLVDFNKAWSVISKNLIEIGRAHV